MIDLIPAGKSFKTHGLKGEIHIQIDELYENFIKREAVLFFNLDGNDVPYFIEKKSLKDLSLVKFKEVNSPEEAKLLCHQEFYIDRSRLTNDDFGSNIKEDQFSLIDFEIIDSTSHKTGRIINIEEFPHQLMALVAIDSNQYYLPLREEWILEMDESKKQIHMNLPEGMFD